jgi:hypothetical protein
MRGRGGVWDKAHVTTVAVDVTQAKQVWFGAGVGCQEKRLVPESGLGPSVGKPLLGSPVPSD